MFHEQLGLFSLGHSFLPYYHCLYRLIHTWGLQERSLIPEIAMILEDLQSLKNSFNRCGILWTKREANGPAHEVAKPALSGNLTPDWSHRFPPNLASAWAEHSASCKFRPTCGPALYGLYSLCLLFVGPVCFYVWWILSLHHKKKTPCWAWIFRYF